MNMQSFLIGMIGGTAIGFAYARGWIRRGRR